MKKILIAIPCLYGAEALRQCLTSITNRNGIHILLIDNGAHEDVKAVISERKRALENIEVWHRDKNTYVTKPWNDSIQYFLMNTDKFSRLIIMNSDLVLNESWQDVILNRWDEDSNEIVLPTIIDDREKISHRVSPVIMQKNVLHSGTPGVFITLNKEQAEAVFPLPFDKIKLWFNDNWIFDILRGIGYETIATPNFIAFHHWSTSVSNLPEASEIIEQDKLAWPELQKMIEEKIKSLS